jgi:hypothetical protein
LITDTDPAFYAEWYQSGYRVFEKYTAEKMFPIFFKNCCLLIPRPPDFHATGEALSPQKGTSRTSIHDISSLFSIFVSLFALLDPDPLT